MRVAIIGAGPGGLFSAYLLEQKLGNPGEISLFEASSRVGGKIQTGRFKTTDIIYEAGTAELYDYSVIGYDHLRQLVNDLGLPTIPLEGGTVILGDQVLRTPEDIDRSFGADGGKALRNFYQSCELALTPEDYYDGHWMLENQHALSQKTFRDWLESLTPDLARKYVEVAVHSDTAAEPNQTNALNALKNILMNHSRYMNLYAIKGGIEKLPQAILSRLNARILYEHPVRRITYDPSLRQNGSYAVIFRDRDGVEQSQWFDTVIIALPDYHLRRLEFGNSDLAKLIEQHCIHYDHPSHYLRISVLFQEPFWRDEIEGNYFVSDAFGGCCVYDEGSRNEIKDYGVLSWLLAGHDALIQSNLEDPQLISKALDSLPLTLRKKAHQFFREGQVHRWLGAINAQPGGIPIKDPALSHRPDAIRYPGLFLVGDYLFDSTLNGVHNSADYVTSVILSETLYEAKSPEGLSNDYFDYYDGERPYHESFLQYFNARYIADLIEAVWKQRPPYQLLDVGSASGLTLGEFSRVGVSAFGVENNRYIHSGTPPQWRRRNLFGDVRKLPFADNSFDFVYDTSLCYLPDKDLEQALRELYRVTRTGIFFGALSSDLNLPLNEETAVRSGVQTLRTLWEWSHLFIKAGFRSTLTHPRELDKVWEIERGFTDKEESWYPGPDTMRYCFYSKRKF